jgi:hypothetical protein
MMDNIPPHSPHSRRLMCLLMPCSVPHNLAERALPTVALEASSMFRSASIARPAAAVELVLKPLVAKIRAQLPESGTSSYALPGCCCCSCGGHCDAAGG